MQFYRQFWRRKTRGHQNTLSNLKSREEINALDHKIAKMEAAEFEKFEKNFDEELKNL